MENTESDKLIRENDVLLNSFNKNAKGTLIETLGIVFTEVSNTCVCGEMPVDNRTKQPFGYLHGGAFMALAETLGSAGSAIGIDLNKYLVFGIEMKGNYIKNISSGKVFGKAIPVHKGKTTQLWNIDMTDINGNLLATCRITNLIVEKQ